MRQSPTRYAVAIPAMPPPVIAVPIPGSCDAVSDERPRKPPSLQAFEDRLVPKPGDSVNADNSVPKFRDEPVPTESSNAAALNELVIESESAPATPAEPETSAVPTDAVLEEILLLLESRGRTMFVQPKLPMSPNATIQSGLPRSRAEYRREGNP